MDQTIRLHDLDNVVLARTAISEGTRLDAAGITARNAIPRGHKMATRVIRAGDPIMKYAQVIGFASAPIAAGDRVHTHNVVMQAFDRSYEFCAAVRPTDYVPEPDEATFQGFVRHANIAGVLLVGLGCEVNQVDGIVEDCGLLRGATLRPRVAPRTSSTCIAMPNPLPAVVSCSWIHRDTIRPP